LSAVPLVDYAQSLPGGDIGIEYDTRLSGVKRARSFSKHDQPSVRELLDKLTAVENGFEWRIRCDRAPETGRRRKLLELDHPRQRVAGPRRLGQQQPDSREQATGVRPAHR
jgi:hypothetical protein